MDSGKCALCNRALNLENAKETPVGLVGRECFRKLGYADNLILADEWSRLSPGVQDAISERLKGQDPISKDNESLTFHNLKQQGDSDNINEDWIKNRPDLADGPGRSNGGVIGDLHEKSITDYRFDLVDKDIFTFPAVLGMENAGPLDSMILQTGENSPQYGDMKHALAYPEIAELSITGNYTSLEEAMNAQGKNWGVAAFDQKALVTSVWSQLMGTFRERTRHEALKNELVVEEMLQTELATREWLAVSAKDDVYKLINELNDLGVVDKNTERVICEVLEEADARLDREPATVFLGGYEGLNVSSSTVDVDKLAIPTEIKEDIITMGLTVVRQEKSIQDTLPSIKHLVDDVNSFNIKDHSSDLMFLAHATDELDKRGYFAAVLQYKNLEPDFKGEAMITPRLFLVKKPHDQFESIYGPASASLAVNLLESRGIIKDAQLYDYKILTTGPTSVETSEYGNDLTRQPSADTSKTQFMSVPSVELFSVKSNYVMSAPHDTGLHKLCTKVAFMLKTDAETNLKLPPNLWAYNTKPCFGFHPARFASSINPASISDKFIQSDAFQNEFKEWHENPDSSYLPGEIWVEKPESFFDMVKNVAVKAGPGGTGDHRVSRLRKRRIIDTLSESKVPATLAPPEVEDMWKHNRLGYNEATNVIGHLATNMAAKIKNKNRHKFYGSVTKNLSERFDAKTYRVSDQAFPSTAVQDFGGKTAGRMAWTYGYGYSVRGKNGYDGFENFKVTDDPEKRLEITNVASREIVMGGIRRVTVDMYARNPAQRDADREKIGAENVPVMQGKISGNLEQLMRKRMKVDDAESRAIAIFRRNQAKKQRQVMAKGLDRNVEADPRFDPITMEEEFWRLEHLEPKKKT